MVIADEHGCEANIGRFVTVVKPATFVDEPGHWWVIRPVGDPMWMCFSPSRGRAAAVSSQSDNIAIEDRALRPIRGLPRDRSAGTNADAAIPSPTHHTVEA
ncbi:hypothetical protein [Hydrogenophaga atypica]|uniref:Uncharacterized protein n=1 Tax=Hydrogenophaga atypica TaxID=249409 RepID=A0ABW2QLF2_9BURK